MKWATCDPPNLLGLQYPSAPPSTGNGEERDKCSLFTSKALQVARIWVTSTGFVTSAEPPGWRCSIAMRETSGDRWVGYVAEGKSKSYIHSIHNLYATSGALLQQLQMGHPVCLLLSLGGRGQCKNRQPMLITALPVALWQVIRYGVTQHPPHSAVPQTHTGRL